MTPFTCPCCHRPYEDRPDPHAIVDYLTLSPGEKRFLNILLTQFGQIVLTDTIVERIYGGVRDGGPLDARNVLTVHAYNLRKKLRPHGFTVEGYRVRNGSGYRIVLLLPPREQLSLPFDSTPTSKRYQSQEN